MARLDKYDLTVDGFKPLEVIAHAAKPQIAVEVRGQSRLAAMEASYKCRQLMALLCFFQVPAVTEALTRALATTGICKSPNQAL